MFFVGFTFFTTLHPSPAKRSVMRIITDVGVIIHQIRYLVDGILGNWKHKIMTFHPVSCNFSQKGL